MQRREMRVDADRVDGVNGVDGEDEDGGIFLIGVSVVL